MRINAQRNKILATEQRLSDLKLLLDEAERNRLKEIEDEPRLMTLLESAKQQIKESVGDDQYLLLYEWMKGQKVWLREEQEKLRSELDHEWANRERLVTILNVWREQYEIIEEAGD